MVVSSSILNHLQRTEVRGREWKQKTDMSPKVKGKDETHAVVQVEVRCLLRVRMSSSSIHYKNSGSWVIVSAAGRSYYTDSLLGCDRAWLTCRCPLPSVLHSHTEWPSLSTSVLVPVSLSVNYLLISFDPKAEDRAPDRLEVSKKRGFTTSLTPHLAYLDITSDGIFLNVLPC